MTKATVNGVTSTYTYRPDGLRQTKTVGGVTTAHVWDGENIIADRNSDNTVRSTYIRGLNLVEYRSGATSQQYSHNSHGDITALTDKTIGASTNYLYDAYGNQQTETTSDINPFRYSGEYYDEETGFIYLRARYYEPTIGRFISEDSHWNPDNMIYVDNPRKSNENKIPSIEAILQSNNIYAYCINNPVMYVDLSGNDSEGILSWAFATAGITSVSDGPLPYGEIVGIIIIGCTAAVAGGIWIGEKISEHVNSKEKAIANAISSAKEKYPNQTVIFRSGSGSNKNLTPRPNIDDNGLSYFTSPPIGKKYTITTVEKINATGVMCVYQDPSNPTHYLVKATADHDVWQKTRDNAEEAPYYLTIILKSISMEMPKIK